MVDMIFGQFGLDILLSVQQFFGPNFKLLFELITTFGDVPVYILIIALLYWLVNKRIGIDIALMTILSGYLNGVLKAIFAWTRPYLEHAEVERYSETSGYSFPSGHSQSSGTFWGSILNEYKNIGIILVSLFFIITVPISRVFLGVHYPSDVILGFIIGICIIFIYLKVKRPIVNYFSIQPDALQYLVIIIFSIILFAIEFGVATFLNRDLLELDLASMPSAFCGALIGLKLEQSYVKFEMPNKFLQYILRVIIGIVVVVIMYLIPSIVFGSPEDPIIDVLKNFTRYFSLGIGITLIIPYLFQKLESNLTLD